MIMGGGGFFCLSVSVSLCLGRVSSETAKQIWLKFLVAIVMGPAGGAENVAFLC